MSPAAAWPIRVRVLWVSERRLRTVICEYEAGSALELMPTPSTTLDGCVVQHLQIPRILDANGEPRHDVIACTLGADEDVERFGVGQEACLAGVGKRV